MDAVRVVACLHDPAASAIIPGKGDGFGDIRLTGEELQFAISRHLRAFHAGLHAHWKLKRERLRTLLIIGHLRVFLALFGITLSQKRLITCFALSRDFGENAFAVQFGFTSLDDDIVVRGRQTCFGVIKPDRITPEITHGIMQGTDGGLFFAIRVDVEHPDRPCGGSVGRKGGR